MRVFLTFRLAPRYDPHHAKPLKSVGVSERDLGRDDFTDHDRLRRGEVNEL